MNKHEIVNILGNSPSGATISLRNSARDFPIEIEKITEEQFNKMSFFEKLKTVRKSTEANAGHVRNAFLFAAFFYWSVSISMVYTSFYYTIPVFFGANYSDWDIYCLKVLVAFIFYGASSNWLLTVSVCSKYEVTEDVEQVDPDKTLWKPMAKNAPRVLLDTKTNTHGVLARTSCMLPYVPESNGLQWSWCSACRHDCPPRAHHCAICRCCILKRDHHCFMTGRCIGFWNQRYFFFLCFYVAIGAWLGGAGAAYWLQTQFTASSRWQFFLPCAVYECFWQGSLPFHVFLMIYQCYAWPWTGCMCSAFFLFQIIVIARGRTTFEERHGVDILVHRSINQRFVDVFGHFWLLNFLFPASLLWKQEGNGVDYPQTYNLSNMPDRKVKKIVHVL